MSNGNGYTNKELLNIIIDTQEKTNERIDLLHEKKKFLVWLDGISTPKVPDNYKEEDWDWIV